jgi:plasmid stabilization system protein ParE
MATPERALIWSEDAEEDMISIWCFGADEWSPATADEHLADIHYTCELLLESFELGKARD